MTNFQKMDALDAMKNILVGLFENTHNNIVFDETSQLGRFSFSKFFIDLDCSVTVHGTLMQSRKS